MKSDHSRLEMSLINDEFITKSKRLGQFIQFSTALNPYVGQVTRTYADGVFKREEAFTSLDKAVVWLNLVYDEELTKHLLKGGIREKEIP